MTKIELKAGERIDQIAASNVQIIQSREVFSFRLMLFSLQDFHAFQKKEKLWICVREMEQWAFLPAQ